jgi:hypothetical protein
MIENGKVTLTEEKDVQDILKFIREGFNNATLNDSQTKLVNEGFDKLGTKVSELFKENNSISEYKIDSKRYHLCLDLLTSAQFKKLVKEI